MTPDTVSHLTHLECSECGKHFDPHRLQTFCPDCTAPLMARYDLDAVRASVDRDAIRHRPKGMWRWHELLPVFDPANMVTLGEGDTPLLPLARLGEQLGFDHLWVKEESVNPTGSFKARGLAAAISKAKELGVTKVIIPTAGNAGGAMAAYAARAGMQAHIIMPADTPKANIAESRVTGAEVVLIDGLISDAGRMAREKAAAEPGWWDVSTFKEPYRCEGKKIMGYEIAEMLGWTLPDVILYPTGGGTGLVGMWKAFDELRQLGWLADTAMPRMVAVQAAGCAPVVQAFEQGLDHNVFWEGAETIASGLRVPKSFADRVIMRDLRESHGTAVAVTDAELTDAQHSVGAAEGLFCAPEGAATVAALIKLREQGWVRGDERVVVYNTGAGVKYV